jgi:hypothetical protein
VAKWRRSECISTATCAAIECTTFRRPWAVLEYAPKLKEIQVTDIKKGIGVFTPKPDKAVSFAALKETLKKAGYTLAAADISVTGTQDTENARSLIVAPSGQRFALEGKDIDRLHASDSPVEVQGDWKTVGEGATSREVITVREIKESGERSQELSFARISARSNVTGFMPARFDVAEGDSRPIANELPALAAKPAHLFASPHRDWRSTKEVPSHLDSISLNSIYGIWMLAVKCWSPAFPTHRLREFS